MANWWFYTPKNEIKRFVSSTPHYCDVLMGAAASQITSLTIVYSAVYSGTDQRKLQSSASLAFVRGIHRGPVNSPHKGPITRKTILFDDVIFLESFLHEIYMCTAALVWLRVCLRHADSLRCHWWWWGCHRDGSWDCYCLTYLSKLLWDGDMLFSWIRFQTMLCHVTVLWYVILFAPSGQ